MFKIGILIFFFIDYPVNAKKFCVIKDIQNKDFGTFNCVESQTLFGYLDFISEKSKFSYITNDQYNLKIIENFYDDVINFINKLCSEEKKIKIKDITNYDKLGKNFKTKIIVSCKYKKNNF